MTPKPGKFSMNGMWRAMFRPLANVLMSEIRLTDGEFWQGWTGGRNYAGKNVTAETALRLSAVWACVRLISESLATMPVNLYQAQNDGSKTVATGHDLYYLLHTQPNADMTAVTFWQSFVTSMLIWGDAFVEKRISVGAITSLEFLLPHRVTRKRLDSGAIEWSYNDPVTRAVRKIPESLMWHTPAFTVDGVCGLSPVRMGANVFGTAMAAEQASAETFTNGMKTTGVVKMNVPLTKEQREQMRAHVKDVQQTGGVMVLENSTGFDQITMNPQDAELLSTRGFSVEEICRWFLVPPFMVGHAEKSTSWGTGIEQQMIGFVTFVLRPWCVRIEQSIRKDLINPKDQLTYSAEFAIEGLLRGDSAARATFYASMVNNGNMTRDEVRRKENLPLKGGNADVLTVQSAMVPIDSVGKSTAASAARAALMNWLADDDVKPVKETQ